MTEHIQPASIVRNSQSKTLASIVGNMRGIVGESSGAGPDELLLIAHILLEGHELLISRYCTLLEQNTTDPEEDNQQQNAFMAWLSDILFENESTGVWPTPS